MQLSENFTLTELTRSATADRLNIRNVPDETQIQNLKNLCVKLLQPLRDGYSKPLSISSGFRCPALNKAANGSPTSDHLTERAADIPTDNPMALFAWVCRLGLSFDQAIIHQDYLHLSYRSETTNRQMVMMEKRKEERLRKQPLFYSVPCMVINPVV